LARASGFENISPASVVWLAISGGSFYGNEFPWLTAAVAVAGHFAEGALAGPAVIWRTVTTPKAAPSSASDNK
jgi:hypothetical protein